MGTVRQKGRKRRTGLIRGAGVLAALLLLTHFAVLPAETAPTVPDVYLEGVLLAWDILYPKPEEDLIEDGEPPVRVDWEEMAAINPDIIGWLYVDGMPNVNYPILYSGDNDYYLHRNYRGEEEFRGSIFLEELNSPDFADPNSLLYGHNMADGSMFGSLKFMDSQERYEEAPYFWILTPRGNYRYKIFAEFFTSVDSEVYLVYEWHGPEFRFWEENWKRISDVRTEVPLTTQDRTVCLTTCTSDSTMRFVVFGKCVSSKKPIHPRYTYPGAELADSSPSAAEGEG